MYTLQGRDLELSRRGWGGGVLLNLPVFLPSEISLFSPEISGGGDWELATRAPPLDLPLIMFSKIVPYHMHRKSYEPARTFRDLLSLVMFSKFSNCTRLRLVQF